MEKQWSSLLYNLFNLWRKKLVCVKVIISRVNFNMEIKLKVFYLSFYHLGNPALPRLLIISPANLFDFTGKVNLRYKSRFTQFRISEPSLKHSRCSPKFPNQNLRQIGPGVHELWSDKQTVRQTKITTLYI